MSPASVADVPTEMMAWHWVGGLLLGIYPCPSGVPEAVEDERLQRVVETLIAVNYVDNVWPVDVRRVVDVLEHVGQLEKIGGATLLIDLVETWSERMERARTLGEIEARARIALALLHQEQAAEDAVFIAIERREQAHAQATEAIANVDAISGAA